jgi:DNA invertase Pin-like site-specific DNA recombinase
VDAVIYTRVSSDQNNGRSVADQERECRHECERNGWPVREVYCDNDIGASSFSGKQRPQWEKLKADLRSGDIVVMWEASRSTRDLGEFVTLRDLCAELQVPLCYSGRVLDLTSGDDRFFAAFDALQSEREAWKISERVKRGKRASAAGGRPFGLAPWGYRRVEKGVWEVDPVEGPRVHAAAERLLEGESQRSILKWLRANGYAPHAGADLCRALCNPTIAGLRVHQGKVIGKGTWPPLITEEQHRQLVAQTELRRRADRYASRPGPEPKYLLSGIAECGKCGRRVRFRNRQGRPPTYNCPDGHVWRAAAPLDQAATEAAFQALLSKPPNNSEATSAQRELDVVELQLAEFMDQAIAGEISGAAFAKIEQGLQARIDDLRPRTVVRQKRYFRATYREWTKMSLIERREAIRDSVRILVNPVPAGRRATDEDVLITPIK